MVDAPFRAGHGEHLDLFECFDGYWQENFGSAVVMMAFRASETFGARLLELIRKRARRDLSAFPEAPGAYTASREEGFRVGSGKGARKGRFDILLVSRSCAIAIEHKTALKTTKEQLEAQRSALAQRFTQVLVCSLSKHPSGRKGEDVVLSWADISLQLSKIPAKERAVIGRRVATAFADFFGGHDVDFSGFPKGDKIAKLHQQRRLLLEALLPLLSQEVTDWHDNRNHKTGFSYQSAGFTDCHGGQGRYLGFYDYAKGDRSELALYTGTGESRRLDHVSWSDLRRDLATGVRDLDAKVEELGLRFSKALKAVAPVKAEHRKAASLPKAR